MSDSDLTNTPIPDDSRNRLSYREALDRIMGLADFERSKHSPGHSSFHLERISLLMKGLNNAHLATPTIHVAGTKGKGSTSAMISSILSSQGYKVGLFTSPHLHRTTERIRVGLEPISENDFALLTELVWPEVLRVSQNETYGAITTFEMLTAMAFVYFKKISADFQVMEVGLGGRLDSTNIVMPEVSVITSISLDHITTLGDTLEKIASEKAGIIKDGVPVIVAPQRQEAMEVVSQVAQKAKASLLNVEAQVSWRKLRATAQGQSFEISTAKKNYKLWTPLLGEYQLVNAGTAIAAVETLASKYAISKESIITGISSVRWPARLDVLSTNKFTVVVDGAHNSDSMERLVQAIQDYFRFKKVILVFGTLAGHSARDMIGKLTKLSPVMIAVKSRHPKAQNSTIIYEMAKTGGIPLVICSGDVGTGARQAFELANEGDLILGTGSLTVAAEIIEEVRGITPEIYPSLN